MSNDLLREIAAGFRKAASNATLPVVVSLPPDWLRAAADALSAPPEPKRLPTVAEMRGILSDENTNAAPQVSPDAGRSPERDPTLDPVGAAPVAAILATARASEAYKDQGAEFDADAIRAGLEPRGCPTPGACSCPAAPEPDEHLPWLQVWLDEKIVRATGVRREVLEDLQHELDARPSPQAAESVSVPTEAMLRAAQKVDYPIGTVPGTTGFPYYRTIYLAMQAAKESP